MKISRSKTTDKRLLRGPTFLCEKMFKRRVCECIYEYLNGISSIERWIYTTSEQRIECILCLPGWWAVVSDYEFLTFGLHLRQATSEVAHNQRSRPTSPEDTIYIDTGCESLNQCKELDFRKPSPNLWCDNVNSILIKWIWIKIHIHRYTKLSIFWE